MFQQIIFFALETFVSLLLIANLVGEVAVLLRLIGQKPHIAKLNFKLF